MCHIFVQSHLISSHVSLFLRMLRWLHWERLMGMASTHGSDQMGRAGHFVVKDAEFATAQGSGKFLTLVCWFIYNYTYWCAEQILSIIYPLFFVLLSYWNGNICTCFCKWLGERIVSWVLAKHLFFANEHYCARPDQFLKLCFFVCLQMVWRTVCSNCPQQTAVMMSTLTALLHRWCCRCYNTK